MSQVKVQVHTLYYENYGSLHGQPLWKAKGGQTFSINIDGDLLFYGPSADVVLTALLQKHCNAHFSYKYLGHEIQLEEPMLLATEEEYMEIADAIWV